MSIGPIIVRAMCSMNSILMSSFFFIASFVALFAHVPTSQCALFSVEECFCGIPSRWHCFGCTFTRSPWRKTNDDDDDEDSRWRCCIASHRTHTLCGALHCQWSCVIDFIVVIVDSFIRSLCCYSAFGHSEFTVQIYNSPSQSAAQRTHTHTHICTRRRLRSLFIDSLECSMADD